MARPRNKKSGSTSRARLAKRAASRGYRLEKDGSVWYAEFAGTRYGPMRSLDEVDEFLPKDA